MRPTSHYEHHAAKFIQASHILLSFVVVATNSAASYFSLTSVIGIKSLVRDNRHADTHSTHTRSPDSGWFFMGRVHILYTHSIDDDEDEEKSTTFQFILRSKYFSINASLFYRLQTTHWSVGRFHRRCLGRYTYTNNAKRENLFSTRQQRQQKRNRVRERDRERLSLGKWIELSQTL